MKQKLLIIGMIVFAVFCSTHATAQPCRRMVNDTNANQANWSCPLWQNLAPEQQTAINSLRTDFIEKTSTFQNQIHKKRLEMDILLLEAEPDTDKLIKLQKEISELNARLDQGQLSFQIKARKKLKPEQRAQLPPGCFLGLGNRSGPRGNNGPCFGAGMGCGMHSGPYGRGCW
jgi:Spy/CpxP family protein refolding chaperone